MHAPSFSFMQCHMKRSVYIYIYMSWIFSILPSHANLFRALTFPSYLRRRRKWTLCCRIIHRGRHQPPGWMQISKGHSSPGSAPRLYSVPSALQLLCVNVPSHRTIQHQLCRQLHRLCFGSKSGTCCLLTDETCGGCRWLGAEQEPPSLHFQVNRHTLHLVISAVPPPPERSPKWESPPTWQNPQDPRRYIRSISLLPQTHRLNSK